MQFAFEFDDAKSRANQSKHGSTSLRLRHRGSMGTYFGSRLGPVRNRASW